MAAWLLFVPLLPSIGCRALLNARFHRTETHVAGGEVKLEGLAHAVSIRRDDLGIPFVEARSIDDLSFAMGYVHASDRLLQMTSFKLIAEGRLSEMVGEKGLPMDLYMRTQNLTRAAALLYDGSSEEIKRILERYSEGVNAYMKRYPKRLPPEFKLAGYSPEPWRPIDSAAVFELITLGLASNLLEEIGILSVAQAVGVEKLAWLLPVYPDEPLPHAEARKLEGIDLTYTEHYLEELQRQREQVSRMTHAGTAASNNWAVSKERTLNNASIFANDTHLPIMMPSMWNLMQVKCPSYRAAGVTLAGVPAVVAGFNGRLAWGMTMAMGDSQDVFLEKLDYRDGKLHYLHEGRWLPTREREETFKVKDGDPVVRTIHETVHGPLLNEAIEEHVENDLLPEPARLPYGLAVSWTVFEPDRTYDAFLQIGRAGSVAEAHEWVKEIRAIALNFVFADRDNIAWRVTGRYPVRKSGRGLVPSPGWTGEHDWEGYLPVEQHPYSVNPEEGFIATANHKTVSPDYPHVISSSWFFPERAQRIVQLLKSNDRHTAADSRVMQYDSHSLFVEKLQAALFHGDLARSIEESVAGWQSEDRRAKAGEAMRELRALDGDLRPSSRGAAVLGAFYDSFLRRTFKDEFGDDNSAPWRAFLNNLKMSYSVLPDHLVRRGDESPFWDDASTDRRETKAEILAESLADAIDLLEQTLGKNRDRWRWGGLHTYCWKNEATKDPELKGLRAWILSRYLNRGPIAAGGDHTTLNVSVYSPGRSFDTWIIPAMRIIVDFSEDEPLVALNSSGQSGNPASDHYADGIESWMEGLYQPMPFREENIVRQYDSVMTLIPPGGTEGEPPQD